MATYEEVCKELVCVAGELSGDDIGVLINESTHLVNDLNFDSLSVVSFVFLCEKKFNISLSNLLRDKDFVPTIKNCAIHLKSVMG